MDIKQKYREETNLDVYPKGILGVGASFSNEYVKWLEEQLRIGVVSKSLNMEHNATSVEYAEAIIDMHKNPENSNRDFKIVLLENTIDKLKQDLANI